MGKSSEITKTKIPYKAEAEAKAEPNPRKRVCKFGKTVELIARLKNLAGHAREALVTKKMSKLDMIVGDDVSADVVADADADDIVIDADAVVDDADADAVVDDADAVVDDADAVVDDADAKAQIFEIISDEE